MKVFERRDWNHVPRLRRAWVVTLLLVLAQAAWTSAQEPRPTDVQTTDRAVAPDSESRRIDTDATRPDANEPGVRWGRVVRQTLSFQGIQHSFFMTQQKSRAALKGPWIHDWFESASSPFVEPHWSDGGSFLINYIGHPMGGSTYAYIYRQNDPSATGIEFGRKRSEERRVGKECRSRWSTDHEKKKIG